MQLLWVQGETVSRACCSIACVMRGEVDAVTKVGGRRTRMVDVRQAGRRRDTVPEGCVAGLVCARDALYCWSFGAVRRCGLRLVHFSVGACDAVELTVRLVPKARWPHDGLRSPTKGFALERKLGTYHPFFEIQSAGGGRARGEG
eukprot:16068-Prymnesium_polylepis.3